MDKMKLAGYVRPDDFEGTDTEKLKKALQVSVEKHIGRVRVTGTWVVTETLLIPEQTELLLENAEIRADGAAPLIANSHTADPGMRQWAMQENWVRITAENSILIGDLFFENTAHLILENVECAGSVALEYAWGGRITGLRADSLTIGRGCKDMIFQNNDLRKSFALDTRFCRQGDVIAKEPDIENLIVQDCSVGSGITVGADAQARTYNLQIDGIRSAQAAVTIGRPGESLPEEQYFNITAIHLESSAEQALILHNAVRFCYFG